jgi:leader peptidase (prepilin peptidase)/N-methyltransferase
VAVALLALLFLLGLAIGSFVNVVIHRVPRGESLVAPGSRCPACGTPILHRHNVPVLGWTVLRGRCAACSAPISPRYPLVELATGGLFVGTALWLAHADRLSALPAYLYLVAAGLALAAIDSAVRRLPDAIVLPSYPVVAVLLAASAAVQGDWWSLARAAIGSAALFAGFSAIAFASPAAMGFGDVKLAGLLGGPLAYLSWSTLVVGAFAGVVLGALFGVGLMALRRAGRRTAIPFGPFMLAGAAVAVVAGEPIARGFLFVLAPA